MRQLTRFTVPLRDEPDIERQQEIEAEKADRWQDQAVDREQEAKEKQKTKTENKI
jgi:hypothetical protein